VRALLEEYLPRVYRFALRLTRDRHQAEDLTQETLLRAWRHRNRLRRPGAACVWLFKIAVNLRRDQVRRSKRSRQEVGSRVDDCESTQLSPAQAMTEQEDLQRVLKTMDCLPSRQREVLYLHACEHLSVAEMADVLDISTDAVKASLCLARKRMRRELRDICQDRFPKV
jgi:RNA polymerase sigma-70 factor (ECF subfamily)